MESPYEPMKLMDSVKRSIWEYPVVFLCDNLEDSIFNVLHHNFLVLGNGMYWARTVSPENGGYLLSETPVENNGGQLPDPDYGAVKFSKDINPLFRERQYAVLLGTFPIKKEIVPQNKLKRYENKKHFLIDNKRTPEPYPYFEKRLSVLWEESVQFMQDDWRQAAIRHLGHWLRYFEDEEKSQSFLHKNRYDRKTAMDFLDETIKMLKSINRKS